MGQKISKTTLDDNDLEIIAKTSQKPKEEIQFWYEHFLKECPSGKLNKETFVSYYKHFRKNEDVDELASHCFNAFDLDKNYYVDFGEFLIAYIATTGNDPREKLKYAFSVYDQDNNKVLDESEIRLVLRAMFKLLKVDESHVDFSECMKNIMASLDINNDKKISVSEFIDGIMNDDVLQALLSPFSLNE